MVGNLCVIQIVSFYNIFILFNISFLFVSFIVSSPRDVQITAYK